MGIVPGHTAKASQESKSSPVLPARVVPQPMPAALAQVATNSIEMAFLLQTAPGNHHKLCRASRAMEHCSREFHGKALQAPTGLGLPPGIFFGQAFLLPPPAARACCRAANTHAFVPVNYFDGQAAVPTLRVPLQCCQTAAQLQPPPGWDVAAAGAAQRCYSAF